MVFVQNCNTVIFVYLEIFFFFFKKDLLLKCVSSVIAVSMNMKVKADTVENIHPKLPNMSLKPLLAQSGQKGKPC